MSQMSGTRRLPSSIGRSPGPAHRLRDELKDSERDRPHSERERGEQRLPDPPSCLRTTRDYSWSVDLTAHKVVEMVDIERMAIKIFCAEVQARAHIGDFRQTFDLFSLPIL